VKPRWKKEFSLVHNLHNYSKIKTLGIFIGTQFTQLFKDQDFSTKLNSTERRGCKAFESICRNFLGNESVENYNEIVQKLISSFSSMGLACPWNFIFCISIWNFSSSFPFPWKHGSHLQWYGERFHLDISPAEKKNSGKLSPNMETLTAKNKKQKKAKWELN